MAAPRRAGSAFAAASAAFAQLQQSDVPGRRQADAQEIVSAKPDLVALQEAVTWSVTPPGQTTPDTVRHAGLGDG